MPLLRISLLVLAQAAHDSTLPSRAPEATEAEPVHFWRFEESAFTGGIIEDTPGSLDLRLEKGGLQFTGQGPADAVLFNENPRPLDLAQDVDPSKLLPSDSFSLAAWVHAVWSRTAIALVIRTDWPAL